MPGGVRCLLAHGAGHPPARLLMRKLSDCPSAYLRRKLPVHLRRRLPVRQPPPCEDFLQDLSGLLAANRHYADGGDSVGSRNLARRRLADRERDGGLQPWAGACMHRRVRLPTGPTADGSPPARTRTPHPAHTRASRPHPHPHPHPHPPSPTRRTCPRTVARPARLRSHRVRDPCRSRCCSGRFHPRFAHIFGLPQARVSDSLPTSSHFVPTYIWYPGATVMLHVA